jgi:hypothetical protein
MKGSPVRVRASASIHERELSLPTPELREEHRVGLPNAFARVEQAIKE